MTIKVFASGQSNMLGRGIGGPSLAGVSSDVRVWNNINPLGTNGTAFTTAEAAQAGGTFQLTDRNNPAVWFCDKLARTQFEPVDLTVVARSSSPIAYWSPSEATYPMLQECIDVWAATGQGPADVFLWHQGESDLAMSEEAYQAAFEALLADLEAAAVISAETLVLTGGLLELDAPRVAMTGSALLALGSPRRRGFATAYGLTTSDGSHFDGDSLYALGARRYFAAYLFAAGRP